MWIPLSIVSITVLVVGFFWIKQLIRARARRLVFQTLIANHRALSAHLAYAWEQPADSPALPAYLALASSPPLAAQPDFFRQIHQEDAPAFLAHHQTIKTSGTGSVEYRLRTAHDQWRWHRESCLRINADSSTGPARLIGLVTDITAERELSASLTRAHALLDHIQLMGETGGWEYDCVEKILHWTPQTYRLHELPVSRETLSLEAALEYLSPTDQPAARAAIEKSIAENKPFDIRLELITARSRIRQIRFTGRPSGNDQQVLRVHGAYHDVTVSSQLEFEKQKLQLKMLETQKLESIGVLAVGIAHDFNNLLTVIISNNALVREDPEASRANLDHIDAAAHRAADLCQQMLSYVHHTPFNLALVELNSLVSETLKLLEVSVRKNAALQLALSSDLLFADADTTQLRQVLMNLVINASDAIDERPGHILVSTHTATYDAAALASARTGSDLPPGTYHALSVTDNGSGMSPETLAKIFDPFFTTKFTGRGLGLAAVQNIIRSHHGALFVESTLGTGTTFKILLPVSHQSPDLTPAPELFPASPAITTLSGKKILIVDDEAYVREVAESFLRRRGCITVTACEGHQALSCLRSNPDSFNLVLLDQTMPGLNGYNTLIELRRSHPTLPVLAVSGYTETNRADFLKIPHTDFLAKPYEQAQLEKALLKLLTHTPAAPLEN